MDGTHFDTRYPVVLRFEGIGPENLAGYEKHRKRVGGDVGHILEKPPGPNRRLIGPEDWAAKALAEIAQIKAQNFAAELEALEKRKRKKDIQRRLAEGPHNPWRPTRHGPMREVILTANKEWFDADPAAVLDEGIDHHQRIADFERLSIAWLKKQFGADVIHARADLDEDAYHIHAVIMPRVCVEMTRTVKKTGEKKVIATRLMLQPSKFDVIEDYEHAQDSVGAWFSEIGLDRGEKRKEAFRQAVRELAFVYADVADVSIQALRWDDVVIDRTNRAWRELFSMALLFLRNRYQTTSAGSGQGSALLFEMNALFEEYIGCLISKALAGSEFRVTLQGGRLFCLTSLDDERPVFQTKPDILIWLADKVIHVIDTKWKRISARIDDPKQGVSQADVYQMMAYAHIYKAPRLTLLYPHHAGLGDDEGSGTVEFERFRSVLERAAGLPRGPKGGRPAMDVVLKFRMLVLQSLHGLSLEATERKVRARLSWMQFCGLGIADTVPERPHNPWRPTRHGPMREVILTANKEWFDADPAAVFGEGVEHNQRIADFERFSIGWLRKTFGDDVVHARADLDEEAYHIHAVIMPRVRVDMTRKDKKTGEKKVIAKRLMLQPSKFDVIEDYEYDQDSVGAWFSEIGLDRGEKRKEAFRQAVAKGDTPPPKRMHTKTRDWRRKKDRELSKRERDLELRSAAVEEKSSEADAIIEITEAVAQGVVDPVVKGAEAEVLPIKGRELDETFLRAQRYAQRSPKGASRVAKAFRGGWTAIFKKAREEAFVRLNTAAAPASVPCPAVTENTLSISSLIDIQNS